MANPYHDADGKFCSRGEMEGAIETAVKKGDMNTYFNLRKDLEAIDEIRDKTGYLFDNEGGQDSSVVEFAVNAYGAEKFAKGLLGSDHGRRTHQGTDPKPTVDLGSHGIATYVDGKPGSEGDGEDINVVFNLNGNLYTMHGRYNSYDGEDWDNAWFAQVEPQVNTQISFRHVQS